MCFGVLFVYAFAICKSSLGTVGRGPHFGALLGCFKTLPASSGEAPGTLLDAIGRSQVAKNVVGAHYVAKCVVKLQKVCLKMFFVYCLFLFL